VIGALAGLLAGILVGVPGTAAAHAFVVTHYEPTPLELAKTTGRPLPSPCALGRSARGKEVPMSAATKWTGPFDDMSDKEFDEHVEALFCERPRTVAVSLCVPAGLLECLKRQATRMGVANQTLVKSGLESAVARL